MNLKERLSHFWNDTLGVDCPEQENIEESQNPELKASLERVDNLEKKYYQASSTSNKGGKGNSGKSIVEQVKVDSAKAMKQAKQVAESKGQKVEENQK